MTSPRPSVTRARSMPDRAGTAGSDRHAPADDHAADLHGARVSSALRCFYELQRKR